MGRFTRIPLSSALRTTLSNLVTSLLLGVFAARLAHAADPVPVTVDNFNRAESDMYFAGRVKESGIGKLFHYREVMPIDKQAVIRVNRDTLYSSGVFELDAGPVTVTLPDPGKRFMSLQVFDEDQYSPGTFYAPKTLTFSKEKIGTRYIIIGIRTFVNTEESEGHRKGPCLAGCGKGRTEKSRHVRNTKLGYGKSEKSA